MLYTFVALANTFLRTGRLFPGPHLYGGLAVLLVAAANVALVPYLRDKNELRFLHTALGSIVLLLLASQVYSGIGILKSLIQSFL